MIKFAWAGPEDARTCADILLDIEEAGLDVVESRFFHWTNPKNGAEYNVVCWSEEQFPDDFDEEAAKAEFFKLLHTEIHLGV